MNRFKKEMSIHTFRRISGNRRDRVRRTEGKNTGRDNWNEVYQVTVTLGASFPIEAIRGSPVWEKGPKGR